MDTLNLTKNQMRILKELLDGDKKMTELQKLIKNYPSLQKEIMTLEGLGFVVRKEERERQRVVYVSLTEKGRAVAEKLKEAEEVAMMTPEELEEQRKRIHWIIDINTFVDHITAYDIHDGKKEIFNIWLRPNGKYLKLYCDKCGSYDCYHINWALNDPVIGPELREKAKKKGLKIKNLEDEKTKE